MLHSQILTLWNSKNDLDLSTWIGEEPCLQMNFWQFSRNADIHIIPGKLSKIYLYAWLFSNPRGKVLFLLKSMGQICPLDFILLRTCPNGEYPWMKIVFWQFSRNNTYVIIPVRSLFACMVVLQSMWRGPNHCCNFMQSGSESATYRKFYKI